ncbi:hypothetical protein JRO89_XS12G0180400 [Xanthoceras sorbifolium]|uniref:Uncharacterized protein n=1 Tax=Xanthoceras sorbifolium TaxID=99658 RepID=A0ABQ8HCZ5_9ROSI|nr:hypothetical protein JRO89_XS12G0180400 [Xanthoceras sorbifolium]
MVEETAGMARKEGFSSPAMMTTILGSGSSTLSTIAGFCEALSSVVELEEEDCFLYEQTNKINDTAISIKTIAKLPKRWWDDDIKQIRVEVRYIIGRLIVIGNDNIIL